jgi:hypothetical protein
VWHWCCSGNLIVGGIWKVVAHGTNALYDKPALDAYIAKQRGLITRSQVLSCGLTREALRHRLRVDGPWQFLIPGVYATFTGAITRAHKQTAALLYAGPGSAITGQSAMAAHGLKDLGRTIVDVLVPATCQRRDQDFVHLLRTWKMPAVLFVSGELRFVPVARAVADAARQLRDIREVRSVVASAVQWGKTSVADLSARAQARTLVRFGAIPDGAARGCRRRPVYGRGRPQEADQESRVT